jgi:hypothetical protein
MFELYSPILAIAFILYPWHLESSVCAYIVSPRLVATQGVGVRRGRVQLHWGAAASRFLAGQAGLGSITTPGIIGPAFFAVITVAAWALRPPARRLSAPPPSLGSANGHNFRKRIPLAAR